MDVLERLGSLLVGFGDGVGGVEQFQAGLHAIIRGINSSWGVIPP